jgi:hypothetical protein
MAKQLTMWHGLDLMGVDLILSTRHGLLVTKKAY